MSDSLSLTGLVARHGERLGLVLVRSGPEGPNAPIRMDGADSYVSGLVGHMNLIRPSRVPVLGSAELAYLEVLEPTLQASMLRRLLEADPLCLVVADGLEVPAFLAASESVGIITARADSHQVVQELGYHLARHFARSLSLHGVFIEVMGVGVLLAGQAGVGKSELALELVSRGHRLIADDAPEFSRVAPDTVEGSCPPALRDFMEVRGLGIVNVRALFGDSAVKPRRTLRLVINLMVMGGRTLSPDERLGGIRGVRDVLGVEIPEVTLPVAPGHNMAVLVESTVRNFILSMKGYDAAEDFAERQNAIMRGEEIPPG
jgi:HPr kinase/phosphorylase